MIRRLTLLLLALAFFFDSAWSAEGANRLSILPESIATPPAFSPTTDATAEGVQGVYYAGPSYQGNPTRVFAYYAIPAHKPGEKVPGMVLVHGGTGTAYAGWVRLWVSRGYAAIAMDLCGSLPVKDPDGKGWTRLSADAGPLGWENSFKQIKEPLEDQWPFYAVNAIARARTLLGSLPEVDNARVGVTGISWGGYLTCLTAGLDGRYLFAAPVYGCGNLRELSGWMGTLNQPHMAVWNETCDPLVYLPQAKMPLLWVTGTNDFAYPLESVRKCAQAVKSPVRLCITLRMPHGHLGPGENPETIRALADSLCKGGAPLGEFTAQGREENHAWASWSGMSPTGAELLYTAATGPWKDRLWQTAPATLDLAAGKVSADLPQGTKMYFFNLKGDSKTILSSLPTDVK